VTPGLRALIAVTVLGAAALVAHLAALWHVLRAKGLDVRWKWAALLPPVTPIAAWRGGKRVACVAWVVLLVAYLVVRVSVFR